MPLHEPEVPVFGVGDAFLNQHDSAAADVLLDEDIGAGDHEVVGTATPSVVDGQLVVPQILMAALRELVADDREFQKHHAPHRFMDTVAVIRRERLPVLRQMPRDLVHLRGLVHRAANEEDPLGHGHVPSSHRVLNVPAANTTAAKTAVTPTLCSVAGSSTKIIAARSASFT